MTERSNRENEFPTSPVLSPVSSTGPSTITPPVPSPLSIPPARRLPSTSTVLGETQPPLSPLTPSVESKAGNSSPATVASTRRPPSNLHVYHRQASLPVTGKDRSFSHPTGQDDGSISSSESSPDEDEIEEALLKPSNQDGMPTIFRPEPIGTPPPSTSGLLQSPGLESLSNLSKTSSVSWRNTLESFQSDGADESIDSFTEDLLMEDFDDEGNQERTPIRRNPSEQHLIHANDKHLLVPLTNKSGAFQKPGLSPIAIRRVSSTPTKLNAKKQPNVLPSTTRTMSSSLSPPSSLKRSLMNSSRSNHHRSLSNPYTLRKQTSLPAETQFVSRPSSSLSPPSSLNRTMISAAALSNTYTLRRQASLPTKTPDYARSFSSLSPPSNPKRTMRSPDSAGSRSSLSSTYTLRRQASLPVSPSDHQRQTPPLPLSPPSNVWRTTNDSVTGETSSVLSNTYTHRRQMSLPVSSNDYQRSYSRDNGNVIERVDTSLTDYGSEDDEEALRSLKVLVSTDDALNNNSGTRRRMVSSSPLQTQEGPSSEQASSTTHDLSMEQQPFVKRRRIEYVLYLSTFAIFGVIIRVFMERLFGLDCEFQDDESSVNDWLSPLSEQICVTASGLTEQTGGAVFVDLPANMLGSFVMGVLALGLQQSSSSWPAILPWLSSHHRLQHHDALHVGITTGMCGSLTTFASWNAQMVVMMDGSQTVLGPQIVPALFGYVLGIMAAISSFLFGMQVSMWLNNCRKTDGISIEQQEQQPETGDYDNNSVQENDPESGVATTPPRHATKSAAQRSTSRPTLSRRFGWIRHFKFICSGTRLPFIILACLIVCFLMGDFVWNVDFYRKLWLQVLFAPPGALLRWFLAARWNDLSNNNGIAHSGWWEWFPWGTFAANLVSSIISVFLLALEFHYQGRISSWNLAIMSAVRVGFAGSLSTVSSFVKELVEIQTHFPQEGKPYIYGFLTIGAAMFWSCVVYIPIVRSNNND